MEISAISAVPQINERRPITLYFDKIELSKNSFITGEIGLGSQ
jgi:hypothetical protein